MEEMGFSNAAELEEFLIPLTADAEVEADAEPEEDLEWAPGLEDFGVVRPLAVLPDAGDVVEVLAIEDGETDETAGPMSKKRRYEYNAGAGTWVKHDPNPNRIMHEPPPNLKQRTLDGGFLEEEQGGIDIEATSAKAAKKTESSKDMNF